MRRELLLLLVALLPIVANAQDPVEIDGIWYNLIVKARQAEVTSKPSGYYSGTVDIPASFTYDGKEFSVTSIGDWAFYNCSGLTSVTIPNSVTSIGGSAFRDCSGLTSVTIPSSVTSISTYAFLGCSSLTSITIPNSVTSIYDYAFSGCSGLTSVTIPNSVTSIGEGAFYRSGLTSVTIPNSVTSIGEGAFSGCSKLTSVHITDVAAWCNIAFGNSDSNPLTYARHLYMNGEEIKDLVIPSSVTSIGGYAFRNCTGLTSVTIPNSVTSIDSYAFESCSGLTSVTIPNSVTSIDSYAFYNCSGLTSVTIPNSVTSIGSYAFQFCSGLSSITIPNSVTSIASYAFCYCSGLTSVTIPNSVTSIGYGAFYGCSGLTSVTIPNSVTSISQQAFSGCSSLTTVTIGSGMKSIGSRAFADCHELTDVYCYAEQVPGTYSNAFQNSYIEYATLHVPAASIELYKATEPWSLFGTKKATDGSTPEPPTPEKCDTPTISYANGELIFNCETEGVEFVSEITDTDIRKFFDAKVSLSATYTITVYAIRAGYEDSDVATATLCWIDKEPWKEGMTEEHATEIKALPVLIQAQAGFITVQGLEAGTEVSAYNTCGMLLDTIVSGQDTATLRTKLPAGSTAIVKIGQRAIKVMVK